MIYCFYAIDLCNAMVDDVLSARSLTGRESGRQVLVLRYEDVVKDMPDSLDNIYK